MNNHATRKWLNLSLLMSLALAPVFAMADGDVLVKDDAAAWEETCTSKGGKVVDLVAQFGSGTNSAKGLSKPFCQFTDNGPIYVVGLETLSTNTSSIAATFAQTLTIDTVKSLPTKPYSNPSLNVCKNLNGTSIVFSSDAGGFVDDTGGELDICVFGDGSSISAWTLIYLANGAMPNIKALISSPLLPIAIPDIYAISSI